MAKSSKDIGKMVTADVDKALANIGSMRPDMKADDTLKAAMAPKKAPSFGEAFKAARAAGDKTFTWGGKSYAAKMAGEGAKRPQLARSGTGSSTPARTPAATTNTPKSDVSARTKEFFKNLPMKPKAEPSAPAPKAEPRTSKDRSAEARERMGKFFSSLNPYAQGDRSGKSTRPLLLTGKEAREANKGTIGGMKKGGKVAPKKMAKGGSIDGCAVRGKTRAPLKKGK